MKNNYIPYIAISFIAYFLLQNKKIIINNNIPTKRTLDDEDFYDFFTPKINNVIISNNLEITIPMALSIIKMESGNLYRTKKNKDVIGDNGNSYGYMQVSKFALYDVNASFLLNYNISHLQNFSTNILIGCMYLNLCYQSAINEGSKNPIKLSFKKYNGGIDETSNSFNSMATNYSNKTYNYYLDFTKNFSRELYS